MSKTPLTPTLEREDIFCQPLLSLIFLVLIQHIFSKRLTSIRRADIPFWSALHSLQSQENPCLLTKNAFIINFHPCHIQRFLIGILCTRALKSETLLAQCARYESSSNKPLSPQKAKSWHSWKFAVFIVSKVNISWKDQRKSIAAEHMKIF